jgi:hypothetical protein
VKVLRHPGFWAIDRPVNSEKKAIIAAEIFSK